MAITLAQQMVRAVAIAQGILALFVMFGFASIVVENFGRYYGYSSLYKFVLVLPTPPSFSTV